MTATSLLDQEAAAPKAVSLLDETLNSNDCESSRCSNSDDTDNDGRGGDLTCEDKLESCGICSSGDDCESDTCLDLRCAQRDTLLLEVNCPCSKNRNCESGRCSGTEDANGRQGRVLARALLPLDGGVQMMRRPEESRSRANDNPIKVVGAVRFGTGLGKQSAPHDTVVDVHGYGGEYVKPMGPLGGEGAVHDR